MPVLETIALVTLGSTLSGGLGACCSVPVRRLCQRAYVGWKKFWTGYHMVEARFEEEVREARQETAIVQRLRKVIPALDEQEALDALGAAVADNSVEPVGVFNRWKAAYKWSRRARIHFNYPSDTPANRIIVSDWLRKTMEAEQVRKHQMENLHPYAVVLTFVRSAAEREAMLFGETFQEVPHLYDKGGTR
ncbi:hypothetical protein 1 [Ginkgo biloba tombusvirus]|nr:hypothetical protein 1 [Ginkgo biloba tombusvirus]